MVRVTFQVVDGADKGSVFRDVSTPLTIGREEGNAVRLNDDRISRFHAKLQEDEGRVVLTDLDSTNGTQVNGQHVQLRVLRSGDQILLGRTLLVFESFQEAAAADRPSKPVEHEDPPAQQKTLVGEIPVFPGQGHPKESEQPDVAAGDEPSSGGSEVDSAELRFSLDSDAGGSQSASTRPPPLPAMLGPAQAAQLIEVLEHVHSRFSELLRTVEVPEARDRVSVSYQTWQALLAVALDLARYIRSLSEPADEQ